MLQELNYITNTYTPVSIPGFNNSSIYPITSYNHYTEDRCLVSQAAESNIYAIELSELGNAVISQLEGGISLLDFLPKNLQRPSLIFDKQKQSEQLVRRSSIEPLIVETGVEKSIVELYASLPEARIRNLTAKDLSFHAAKCMDCGGLGYKIIKIASLGKIAETCKTCFGSRYQEQISFVKYQDATLSELLEFNFLKASEFFAKRSEISGPLKHLIKLGLENYCLGDEGRTLPSKAKLVIAGAS